MNIQNKVWLKGMLVAFIGGAMSSVANAAGAMTFDAGHFNLTTGLTNLAGLVAMNLLIGGVIGVSAYLRQSPLPPTQALPPAAQPTQPALAAVPPTTAPAAAIETPPTPPTPPSSGTTS